jgi:hypothetical protein
MVQLAKMLKIKLFNFLRMMATKNKEPNIFIWTKTERAGDIVTEDLEHKDSTWLYFTDGTRINKSVLNEYTLRAKNMEEARKLAEPLGLSYVENDKTFQVPKLGVEETVALEVKSSTFVTEENNVMLEMLKKMSKKNTAEMSVSINIPSQAVYNMLRDEMDLTKKELHDNISMLIVSQIDSLRDQLKSQVDTFIKNYYNVGTSPKPE